MPHEDTVNHYDPSIDRLTPGFFEGATAFNRGAYFLAHEHWEQWWIASGRPERGISKALIQLAAAMYHLQRGNRRGCAKLLDSARLIVAQAPPTALSAAVAELAQGVNKCLEPVERDGLQPPAPHFAAEQSAVSGSPADAMAGECRAHIAGRQRKVADESAEAGQSEIARIA